MAMTYYKLIGSNKTRYKYTPGLNTLNDEPFNPDPNCRGGGFYFCKPEHLFLWLRHGDKVCELTIPLDANVVELKYKLKTDKIFIKHVYDLNQCSTLEYLLWKGVDMRIHNDYPLRYASESGYVHLVNFLVTRVGCRMLDWAVRLASIHGQTNVVQFLVDKGADVTSMNNYTLRYAIENNCLDVVQFLVEQTNADISKEMLDTAKSRGNKPLLAILLANESLGSQDRLYYGLSLPI